MSASKEKDEKKIFNFRIKKKNGSTSNKKESNYGRVVCSSIHTLISFFQPA